ncbi:hypothetical protein DQ04_08301000, partial [Trypanosoma grayi]|uniref:hypothetical protein n=1 Tax=Trypanosoma grayi TaxID=71804 RepID=UPI0004F4B938
MCPTSSFPSECPPLHSGRPGVLGAEGERVRAAIGSEPTSVRPVSDHDACGCKRYVVARHVVLGPCSRRPERHTGAGSLGVLFSMSPCGSGKTSLIPFFLLGGMGAAPFLVSANALLDGLQFLYCCASVLFSAPSQPRGT